MSRCTDFFFLVLFSGAAACAEAPIVPDVPLVPLSIAPCTPVVERLQHLDQPSALGFSAVELLARVAGESSSPLAWLPPEPSSEYTLAYGPENGSSSLRVQVMPAEGEVLYRHELRADDAPDDLECGEDVLLVPVTVSVRSGAGALDETFPAQLEASTMYRAQLTHRFARSSGAFDTDLRSLDPQRSFSAGPLLLQATLWEGGSQGSLSTEVLGGYSESASAAARAAAPVPLAVGEPTYLAQWPSAEPCGGASMSRLPSDAKVLGFSVADVLSALGPSGPRELTWSTGEVTALELDFVPPPSELCQSMDGALVFEASVRVRTADGKLSAQLPVEISADGAGTIGEISVQTPEQETNVPGADDTTRVDLDASFRSGLSTGTLTVSGVDAKRAAIALGDERNLRELASGRWTR
ncbi:MAG TPA: hypothetical protein VFS67_07655 [Polyangiaceae bacterium]|nr:hypothetical protein [Polyangiaceae bacterium]